MAALAYASVLGAVNVRAATAEGKVVCVSLECGKESIIVIISMPSGDIGGVLGDSHSDSVFL